MPHRCQPTREAQTKVRRSRRSGGGRQLPRRAGRRSWKNCRRLLRTRDFRKTVAGQRKFVPPSATPLSQSTAFSYVTVGRPLKVEAKQAKIDRITAELHELTVVTRRQRNIGVTSADC